MTSSLLKGVCHHGIFILSRISGLLLYFVSVCLLITFYFFSLIFSQITSLPLPSHPPWPWMWQPSGGIIVPCSYILFCDPKDHLLIYQIYTQLWYLRLAHTWLSNRNITRTSYTDTVYFIRGSVFIMYHINNFVIQSQVTTALEVSYTVLLCYRWNTLRDGNSGFLLSEKGKATEESFQLVETQFTGV